MKTLSAIVFTRKAEFLFLSCFVCIALAIRLAQGNYNLIFPYDQARDVLVIQSIIAQKDLPLLGPVSDITGVHHGPWFYYLLTPLYFLGNYDPTLALFFFALLSALTVVPLYFLAKSMFNSQAIAVTAVLLFTFSFEAISYARWISNPVLAIPLMPLFVLSLWRVWEGKKGGAILSGIFLGLITGVSLVLAHQLLTVLSVLLLKKKSAKDFALFFIGGAIGALPLVLAEFKFKFQGIRGLTQFLLENADKQTQAVSKSMLEILHWFGFLFFNTIAGITLGIATAIGILLVVILLWLKKNEDTKTKGAIGLLLLVASFYFILPILRSSATNFFFCGFSIPLILLVSYLLSKLKRKFGLIVYACVMICIVGLQLRLYTEQSREHKAFVQVQKGVWFSDRMKVLDTVYSRIGTTTPFSVSIFGTPYGIRSAWAYYFSWYSNKHMTTTPTWYGYVANGYVGDAILPHTDHPSMIHVAIYEPYFEIPDQFKEEFTAYQNQHTEIIDRIEVSHHVIEFRKPKQ